MAITKIKSLGITDGTIATGDIADDAVTSAKIPNNAIGTTEVTDNAVTTAKITDANVTYSKLATPAVYTAQIANDAVTQAKIGADAVGTDELSNSLNINTSGFIQTTGAGGLHATHGTAGSNVASIINTGGNSNSNGVLYVKQSAATNQPTMVIDQVGEGGNPSDTQGLHIKMAGQNQGSGKAIRVTTTNSNLNSGTAYDPFTVTNGGSVTIRNTSNAITSYLDSAGSHTRPKQPGFISIRGSTRLSAANGYSSGVYHTVPFDANGTGNFDTRNNYSTSTERFTFPTTGKYLIGFKESGQADKTKYAMDRYKKEYIDNIISQYSNSVTEGKQSSTYQIPPGTKVSDIVIQARQKIAELQATQGDNAEPYIEEINSIVREQLNLMNLKPSDFGF